MVYNHGCRKLCAAGVKSLRWKVWSGKDSLPAEVLGGAFLSVLPLVKLLNIHRFNFNLDFRWINMFSCVTVRMSSGLKYAQIR